MPAEVVDPVPLEPHLEVQLAVSRLLAAAHASGDVLTQLLQTLGEGLHWKRGELWTLDRMERRLRLSNTWLAPGLRADHLEAASANRTFGYQEGVPGRVWAARCPLWIDDVAQDGTVLRGAAAREDGLTACCAFPAVAGDEVVAVLLFFSDQVRPPDHTLLLLTASVGMLVGAFLERTRVWAAAEALRAGQERILGRIASGQPLQETLDELVRVVEAQAPRMLGSIVQLDADGRHLRHAAAPGLPLGYVEAIDGAAIGPAAGSCGTAMYRRELVVVSDIQQDPLWDDYRHLAAPHGLRACWSKPILSSEGEVLGSFAMYYREPRLPTYEERELIGVASQLASIAFERRRAQEELRRAQAEHEAQRRAAEERLQRSEKIEAIGRLAGGVAHDFNNLLAVIAGHCELLRRDVEPRHHPRVAEIVRAAERAAALTRQLLAFGRKQVLAPRTVGLNAVVAPIEPMLRRLIGEDIHLTFTLAADVGRVRVDPGQIEQVIVNLAVNARDAMPAGGRLTFETANVVFGESEAAQYPEARVGPYVRLTAHDTGCGMDADTQSHIFEPFFKTKEQGKGTGLGLATVYGIIQQSGGLISVSSATGRGARFDIYLPRVEGGPSPAPAPPISSAPPRGGSERILLVEDDDALRDLLGEILKQGGYDVLVCASGEEALRTAEAHEGGIDLVLTDVVMPRMSGRVVAETLRRRRPEMRVLYTSGYTDDHIVRHGVSESAAQLMAKPFTPDAAEHRVRQVLDQPP